MLSARAERKNQGLAAAAGAYFKILAQSLFAALLVAQLAQAADRNPVVAPPGSYHTSWIGNSFGGNGAGAGNPNGFGYWVQDNAYSIAVSPDGTVFLGAQWDEAGRTVGLYKNGQTNRVLVSAQDSPLKTWGFNTSNNGVCVNGGFFYVAVFKSGPAPTVLLRFRWNPGDINSAQYVDATPLPQIPISLSCDRGKIVVSYANLVEVRDQTSLRQLAVFPVPGLRYALPAPDGSFWVISGKAVRHYDPKGNPAGLALPGIGDPTSLAWGRNGQLIVTDNGPAQQVLFFDLSATPRLASTFGVKGGLYAGTPGALAPDKLFALRGAGIDAEGNLYVAMSFLGAPPDHTPRPLGNTFLRAFSASGKPLWQVYATAFVDAFGFQPGSNGTIVFGRTTRWQLNLDRQTPGSEAVLQAVTLDPLHYPDDSRLANGMSVYPRLIHGTQLLYCLAQKGGGFEIFAGTPGSEILHQVDMAPQTGVGWSVTDTGDIWNADAPHGRIAQYPIASFTAAGLPVYDWKHPVTWPWPADFSQVTRVIYDGKSDSLYVFGYPQGQQPEARGVLGYIGRRYDGWMSGKPVVKWTNSSLPITPDGLGFGRRLSSKEASLAGDYLFLGTVRNAGYQVRVNILNAHTGGFVGAMVAGPEVGNAGGNEDIYGPVQATRTAQGEYLVLVEEDWRAKNLLFRWKPGPVSP